MRTTFSVHYEYDNTSKMITDGRTDGHDLSVMNPLHTPHVKKTYSRHFCLYCSISRNWSLWRNWKKTLELERTPPPRQALRPSPHSPIPVTCGQRSVKHAAARKTHWFPIYDSQTNKDRFSLQNNKVRKMWKESGRDVFKVL